MFTITGIINDNVQTITYNFCDGVGKLTGDTMIIFLVEDAMKSVELIGPVGQYMERDVNNPLAVLFVIKECFHSITKWEGDLPKADPIPDGAI
jgi:hypothetical protein